VDNHLPSLTLVPRTPTRPLSPSPRVRSFRSSNINDQLTNRCRKRVSSRLLHPYRRRRRPRHVPVCPVGCHRCHLQRLTATANASATANKTANAPVAATTVIPASTGATVVAVTTFVVAWVPATGHVSINSTSFFAFCFDLLFPNVKIIFLKTFFSLRISQNSNYKMNFIEELSLHSTVHLQ